MLHPASYIPTAPLFSLNLRLLWLFRFEERRELRNISLECFSKGRGVGFSDFGMELKNLGSGTMTLTGQMGLSEWNELPICPVVFSHLSDPLVFLTPWSGAKDNAPPLWIRLYKLYSAFLGRFTLSKNQTNSDLVKGYFDFVNARSLHIFPQLCAAVRRICLS